MNNEGQANKIKEKKVSVLADVVCSNSGKHISPVYKRQYVERLDKSVVIQVDEFNLQEFIQSSKSQTDLALLEKRYLELGEIPSVDGDMGSVDTTLYPSNIHELYKMVNDVDGNFKRLPESVQKVFGTKEAYLKALLDGSYNQAIISAFSKPQDEPKEKENNE